MNFWARTSPGEAAFEYQGAASWEVRRPADGEPVVRHQIRCPACSDELTFTVYSVAATEHRRERWRWGVWVGGALVVLGLVGLASGRFGLAIAGGSAAVAGVLAGVFAWTGGLAEAGVTGHGNGLPGVLPKHAVFLDPPSP
ncbi:hypothetical protein BBK82_30670 [Lentzea guizhouensis]|uniref:Uncharacterized protein n=1 Tax=Lentzea guizhouensis TaxID=1586287 RepID=A0A1B2HPV1_9PSEU|nr:hypothetical protein BBK82_30670 [Lentzea guizhouensis]